MDKVSVHLRKTLWQKGVSKVQWEGRLSEWLDIHPSRAREILLGNKVGITEEELRKISTRFNITSNELLDSDPLQTLYESILTENLNYLVDKSLGHGGKQVLANYLEVEPGTVSRWMKGVRSPSKADQIKISKFFSVRPGIDLEVDPIFLSYEYLGVLEMREWLKQKSEIIDKDSLSELFPALRKLLG